jgi:CRP-like cAMP-binding protein
MNASSLPDDTTSPLCASAGPAASPTSGRVAACGQDRKHRSYPAGSIIYLEGAPVTGAFGICSGGVILTRRDKYGVEHVVGRERRGAILGYRDPAGEGVYLVTAIADTDVTLCCIPIEEMRGIVTATPPVVVRLLQSFSQRIDRLESMVY